MVSFEQDATGITAEFKIAKTTAGNDALEEAATGLRSDFSVGVEDNVLYLLSKDFFSFELNDRSLLLLITIAKFLKESGKLNIVIIGGSHSKKEFMQRVITNFTCIDYAFYNEIWSKPNYDDLIDCLMDIESNNITERNNLNRRNYFYRSCDGSSQCFS
jgi:hypothetical protein